MNSKVCIDASFILKLVLPEDYSEKVHLIWAEWVEKGKRVYAPYLLMYETHSVIRNKVYREEITSNEGIAASEILRELEIILYHSPVTVKIAWDFARKYNRPTLYDTFYLAVSKEIESEFWTADQKLVNSLNNGKEISWVRSVFDL
jgi:predicted nucleic acid-binding protein